MYATNATTESASTQITCFLEHDKKTPMTGFLKAEITMLSENKSATQNSHV